MTKKKPNTLFYYCKLVESDSIAKVKTQREKTNQRARMIAEQLTLGKGATRGPSKSDPIDKITLDVPLLIRLLEYAREDAKTDMDLHVITDQLIRLSKEHSVLDMSCYQQVISNKNKKNEQAARN